MKKKRKRGGDDDEEVQGEGKEKKKGKAKLRFRIRLIFGVKPHDGVGASSSANNSRSEQRTSDDDEYSSEEESEEAGERRSDAAAAFRSWIPNSRLLPDRCNNRPLSDRRSSDDDGADGNAHRAAASVAATPHYTNELAEDLHLLSTTDLISDTIESIFAPPAGSSGVVSSSPFHETLLLLKVWALQRGLLRGHDAFTTTTLALVLSYLYRTKAIGRRMGAVQGLVAFMKFWSECDWLGEDTLLGQVDGASDARSVRERKVKRKAAFVMPELGMSEARTIARCAQNWLYLDDLGKKGGASSTGGDSPRTLVECYKVAYTSSSSPNSNSSAVTNSRHVDSPILLDPTMTINYLARLSSSFVRESRAEARAALRYVHGQESGNGGGTGAFRKLFLETNRFWTRYDAYVRVPVDSIPRLLRQGGRGAPGSGKRKSSKVRKGRGAGDTDESGVWGHDVNDLGYDESVRRGIVGVLSRALGDRVTSVRLLTGGNGDIAPSANTTSNALGGQDDVATKAITDSDECVITPVRGGLSSKFGYSAAVGDRRPSPTTHSMATDQTSECIVVGLRIDPASSRRIVDRGPPAEDVEGSSAFAGLWGESAAQLRRFQDGAIVRAVVWNNNEPTNGIVDFSGMDQCMGGIVEKIVRHIVRLHFSDAKLIGRKKPTSTAFELRNVLSFIDGVASSSPFEDSLSLHKKVMTAFESLSDFLRQNTSTTKFNTENRGCKVSNLGLPLSIDEVEPLDECLRYSSLFPPLPHPLLGGTDGIGGGGSDKRKVSGVNAGTPILIQIRFEGSSKWPTSLNAMGAAKTAMLLQLADGIEKMKTQEGRQSSEDLEAFDGPIDVTMNYLDFGYRGYSWRIIVRADQELRMLRNLSDPTAEARKLRLNLINRHVRGAMHHSLIHAVHTRHPSASSVVRLAQRWVASHMLSDMIPIKAVELLVASIYSGRSSQVSEVEGLGNSSMNNLRTGNVVDAPPSTVVAGFLSFLRLLFTHDWAREPLIVDPQNHIAPHDRELIHSQFTTIRGPDFRKGPAMYLISPADYDSVEAMVGSKVVGNIEQQAASLNEAEKIWSPTVTANFPEKVVLARATALAKCSHSHLVSCIRKGGESNGWVAAFQESSASLKSYSVLLRVDQRFVTDLGCSSTGADFTIVGPTAGNNQNDRVGQPASGPFQRSLHKRYAGPKELRKKHYKNLVLEKDTLHEWQPVKALVNQLRAKYSDYAVFFYNEYTPDVIAIIWRPDAFKSQPFSAMVSAFKQPAMEEWKEDSLVLTNTDDLMAEIGHLAKNIVSKIWQQDNENK